MLKGVEKATFRLELRISEVDALAPAGRGPLPRWRARGRGRGHRGDRTARRPQVHYLVMYNQYYYCLASAARSWRVEFCTVASIRVVAAAELRGAREVTQMVTSGFRSAYDPFPPSALLCFRQSDVAKQPHVL